MNTLLIDNYDSYTYNVFHLLAAVSGEEPKVVHNDMVSWKALSGGNFDAIVLSPGPGRPQRWHDFGVCADILRHSEVPVLGICLGHQGIGDLLNGNVAAAPTAMHGRLSRVHHDDTGLFVGIPQGFSVVRYHSLAVSGSLGAEGRVTAWTDDGVVMGIEHRSRPLWGVQFHPESIATEHGGRIVTNFYDRLGHRGRPRSRRPHKDAARSGRIRGATAASEPRMKLRVRSIAGEPSTELLFERLFGKLEHAFWLDSADAPTRLARRSYLGTSAGADRCVLEYDVVEKAVKTHRAGPSRTEQGSIFDVLDRELAARSVELRQNSATGLLSGFVGYVGYECKADCGSPNVHRSDVPDAVLMLANRVVAVDHVIRRTELIVLCHEGDRDAARWLDDAEAIVRELLNAPPAEEQCLGEATRAKRADGQVSFTCGRGREQYLADIARCQAALASGESYEVCLTDQITTSASPEPLELYRVLRRVNPAPFAAYLKLGELAVLSSSPERFLSIDRERHAQARPIKGTISRSADPIEDEARRSELMHDEKTYAEHLMIVDLLRNDLGRVCEVDSVRVPELMVVEPYTTVHQVISTVMGVLQCGCTPVQCVRACFPGGSMTGAPKLRTMDIIDDIEREARGVYSGCLGYFGVDGSVDLSIVIRTVVMRPGVTTIGAGGAIVTQSDPEQEFEEILLKARAPMSAIAEATTGSPARGAWRVEVEPNPPPAQAA